MSTFENPAAFPSVCRNDPGHPASVPGMTLRDWFAGQFIMGWRHSSVTHTHEHIAAEAYRTADAMLAAREQKA